MTGKHSQIHPAALLTGLLLAGGCAMAQPADAQRGRLLYETHCIACHGTQVHWRDGKLAADWRGLRAQVKRWQATAQLHWTEADIDAVAHHLNNTIYHHAAPARPVGAADRPSAWPRGS